MALAPIWPGTLPLTAVMVITTAVVPSRRSSAICSQMFTGLLSFVEKRAYSGEMISIAQLNALSDAEFVTTLGGIYEHSPWVARSALSQRPLSSLETLRRAMRQSVENADDDEKLTLIRAHPDLAGKLARIGALTESSAREQAGLGLDRLTDAEYASFSENNERYRDQFGFPFIICARLTTKQGVLDAFVNRLGNTSDEEVSEALIQIHEIARLRLEEAVCP